MQSYLKTVAQQSQLSLFVKRIRSDYLRDREYRHCLIDIKSEQTICCFFPC